MTKLSKMQKLALMVLLAVAAFSLLPEYAVAQNNPDNILDGIIERYRQATATWTPIIKSSATTLFWSLAFFEISYTGINTLLNEGTDARAFISALTRRVLFIGFFWNILAYSDTWCKAIVDSFRQIGADANVESGGLTNISPSEIFDTGLDLGIKIAGSASALSPVDSIGLVFSSLVVFICLALISAFLLVALVEMYIALNAGILILGFGATRFTNDYALKFLAYVVSVGVKLFIMQLLVGIGENFIREMAGNVGELTYAQILIVIGASIVLMILVKTIPDILQGVINGANFSTGGGSSLATGAAGVAVGAAIASGGSAMAVTEAAKLASAQGSSGALGTSMKTGTNLFRHGVKDIGGRMSGSVGWKPSTMGGRMAGTMRSERLGLANDSISKGSGPESLGKGPAKSATGFKIASTEKSPGVSVNTNGAVSSPMQQRSSNGSLSGKENSGIKIAKSLSFGSSKRGTANPNQKNGPSVSLGDNSSAEGVDKPSIKIAFTMPQDGEDDTPTRNYISPLNDYGSSSTPLNKSSDQSKGGDENE